MERSDNRTRSISQNIPLIRYKFIPWAINWETVPTAITMSIYQTSWQQISLPPPQVQLFLPAARSNGVNLIRVTSSANWITSCDNSCFSAFFFLLGKLLLQKLFYFDFKILKCFVGEFSFLLVFLFFFF